MDTILTWRIAKILLRELHEHGFVQLYEREMAVREVLSALRRAACSSTGSGRTS